MADRPHRTADRSRAHGADALDARPVRVLAVDDQRSFLHAARRLIADTPGFEQVGEALSGAQAVEMVAELQPDIVLLDVRMTDMDGIETARRLASTDADAAVLLVSLEDVPDLPASAGSVGAAGYLRKQDLSTRALRDFWTEHRQRAR